MCSLVLDDTRPQSQTNANSLAFISGSLGCDPRQMRSGMPSTWRPLLAVTTGSFERPFESILMSKNRVAFIGAAHVGDKGVWLWQRLPKSPEMVVMTSISADNARSLRAEGTVIFSSTDPSLSDNSFSSSNATVSGDSCYSAKVRNVCWKYMHYGAIRPTCTRENEV